MIIYDRTFCRFVYDGFCCSVDRQDNYIAVGGSRDGSADDESAAAAVLSSPILKIP